MDRRERFNDTIIGTRAAIDGALADVWTSLPGKVISYDATKQTAAIQVCVQAKVLSKDGVWSDLVLSPCEDVPVCFPGGGGFTMTFPIAAGDEGIITFAARCIDGWFQQGGSQPQAELRMHDPSDGMFIPGIRSQPRKLGNVSTTKVQLRSDDGLTVVAVDPNTILLSLGGGAASIAVDNVAHKVLVVAAAGLWVNGVQVTVP